CAWKAFATTFCNCSGPMCTSTTTSSTTTTTTSTTAPPDCGCGTSLNNGPVTSSTVPAAFCYTAALTGTATITIQLDSGNFSCGVEQTSTCGGGIILDSCQILEPFGSCGFTFDTVQGQVYFFQTGASGPGDTYTLTVI